ncbi:hypothetical protein [Stigmatella erecta]|uniref:tRNA nuclease CdiA C-terminal domain-containing protein n=1 Tax=Stigmatella erecta TaxID=83460 RepID=A0A1I0IQW6_9BACT|nr:hypothetical protein [Stigmatella erecta]SET99501.1 hypothetical protein SAMN05443639_106219 [Stigmatella erecta]
MTWRWGAVFLLGFFWTGCTASRVVRLDTGHGEPIVYSPPKNAKPIEIREEEFQKALTQLVLDMHFSLQSQKEERPRYRLVSWEGEDRQRPTPEGNYQQWCARQGSPEECFTLLGGGMSLLDAKARRELALSFAWDSVWEGVQDSVKETLNPLAFKAMVTSAMGAYMLLLVMPEPVTKLVALALTTYFVAYLGLEVFFGIVDGWGRLTADAEKAISFEELQEAGHRFGKVMGKNGARVILLALTAALSGGAANMASKGPHLPGFARAALAAETQAGIQMSAALAGGIRSISVAEGIMTVGLAPHAVAMTAKDSAGRSTDHKEHVQENSPTRPSLPPNPHAKPGGKRTELSPSDDAPTKRSILRENEAADLLARNGYQVRQNPPVPGRRNPDFEIEGRIFDNYAPSTDSPRNIWSELNLNKVNPVGRPRQADRIVLDLRDSPVDMKALTRQFRDWPMPNLREVLVISKDGKIVPFWP